MKTLMVTWTDIFEGTAAVFEWIFKGMKAAGHTPNVFIGGFVVALLGYWCLRLVRYKKEAARNGTIE
ncbi:MAG: hypothetical protein KBG47_04095 [Bacteroidia bacterium]|jgi:hypothetical protein|nr:hypothetical protein [Sphingobacteriaceae bacterium]MBK7310682.1 hypothetical protein [Sphingobacteriaceae bacterium]MBP9068663.1 hypothetical protein [Bacteroidia bacterium]